MKIRKAKMSDIPHCVEIYNQAVASQRTADTVPVTLDSRREWFLSHRAERYPLWVAESSGHVMGYLSLSPYRPGRAALRHTAELSFYIHEDYQQQGVGSSMITYILEASIALDIKTLFAILLENNKASIRLLEKFGFEQWAYLPDVADFDGVEVGQLYYGLRL